MIDRDVTRADEGRPGGLVRSLPMLGWLMHYDRSWLSGDLIAGATVWALVIPQSIAYASVAGVPAQYGLYTTLGAALVFALLSGTRQVFAGPSATVAAVAASVCTMVAASGSAEYVTAMVGLTAATALAYALLGTFRMGWVSNFLASAVLEGFVFAFGFGLIADQLYKILGVPKVEGSYWQKLVGTLQELPQTNPYTLALGSAAILLLLAGRYFAPKLPRAIIVVALGIAVVPALGLTTHGVAVVGDLPSGLPSLTLPTGLTAAQWGTLLAGSLAVVLVGFSESIAAATEMALKHGREISANQELVALGGAHAGAALLGGFAVSGSLSKTSVADDAGQNTQLGSLVVAALTVVTLLFLTALFANLPNAVLGAIVIDAAIGLVHLRVPARFLVASRRDFAVFVATGIGLFFVGVVVGVVFGVVLSLLLLISVASKSPIRRMGYDEAEQTYVDIASHPDAKEQPGVLVAAIHGPLFFADAAGFRSTVLEMAAESEAEIVVVDLAAAADVDLDGAEALGRTARELRSRGAVLRLARLEEGNSELLRRSGALEEIGEENLFITVRAAATRSGDGGAPGQAPATSERG